MLDYLNTKLASILMVVGVACSLVVFFELFVMANWSLLWWYVVGTLLMMVLASAFYHRQVCHKTWDCPNWLRIPFTFVAGGLGLAPAIQWCAIHRQHHAHPDQEEDAHGPHFPITHNLAVASYPPSSNTCGTCCKTTSTRRNTNTTYRHQSSLLLRSQPPSVLRSGVSSTSRWSATK